MPCSCVTVTDPNSPPLRATAPVWLALLALLIGPANLAGAAGAPASPSVRGGGLTASTTPDGRAWLNLGGDQRGRAYIATKLAGCRQEGLAAVRRSRGGMETARELVHEATGMRCRLIESLRPAYAGLRWEVGIQGEGAPWTTAIETHLFWPDPARATFWTAWGAPDPSRPGWQDPLQPMPFRDLGLRYGGANFASADAISIPIATILSPAGKRGLSVVLSPEDLLLDTMLTTSADGHVAFSRTNHRISRERPVRFAMDLVGHEANWRAGLGWMVHRYPAYFDPPNPRAHEIAGCGAYSSDEGDLDVRRFTQMAFSVNWKASYDFPYMGMFLPPVGDETRWPRFGGGETSIAQMRDYARRMRDSGFSVLSYFNVTEFGARLTFPPPPRKAADDANLWRDPNDFLYHAIPGAVLHDAAKQPSWSWEGALATDCGDPAYQTFLLDQARRHIKGLPDADGLCIDRMDWLQRYNPLADDGVSLFAGKPARSLVSSWHELMGKLGPMMHAADKVIFVNPHYREVSFLKEVDGIYDEFGGIPQSLNLCAFLGLRKPVMEWTGSAADLRPDADAAFQRHLYMGVFPTAPLPRNDHTINPDPWADPFYLDYGPLLDALRGRAWVLGPGAIVGVSGAKANLFAVPGGYCVPVVFGGNATQAEVVLRGLDLPRGRPLRVEVIRPGETEWTPLPMNRSGDLLRLRVPLSRGCAVARILHTWLLPQERCFLKSVLVEMGTAWPGGVVRYTLDGSTPTPRSTAYPKPIRLTRTTTIRAALFVRGRQVGPTIARPYVRAPLSAPTAKADRRVFEESATVGLAAPAGNGDAPIRYTLDGSDPTEGSAAYDGPITIRGTCTLKARLIASGMPPGLVLTEEFHKLPPLPPVPDVGLSSLEPVTATAGWGGPPRRNRSIQDRSLTVAGRTWDTGIGTHANSELVYDLRPEFRRFVAVVGIDDEMRDYDMGSIVCRVMVDGRLLAESPVLRQNDHWCFDVAIPPGSRRISLIAWDAGDGINCDHADWAAAGFVSE